ncbi:hypothetical protein OIU77_000380 [Salix suchowensis]|uniref:DM2 domain-containing protein n=1 Tax=Salix suchowensis TaxID=1278906 RepID=A0ABQ9B882_9ROSI|nr:hypothetical protein OIU77_000380 [Salix suchowensis]
MNNSGSNPGRSIGVPPSFVNSGAKAQSMHLNHQASQLLSQSLPQTQGGHPGHFQLSDPQAQVLGHAQYAQAAHAQFQSQIQLANQSIAQLQNVNSGNVGVQSPPVATPSSTSAKKSHKPPSRPSGGSSNANMGSLFKTMELTPAALYTQLLEFEARVDAAMARKKTDIQESLKTPPRVQKKTLRVYVFNTFENQVQEANEKKNAAPPCWALKIIGRILEDGKDPVLTGMIQKSYPKFSSYFKKITIYLDQSLYPDNHVILWESTRSPVLHEGFEVKRKGNKEFTARIRLEMNYVPEKFKLSPVLSEVLGIEIETRPRILAAIWHYVKSRKLQNPNDPSFFTCDPPLQKLFGEEKMKFSLVSQKISLHLTPPQPIHLEHKIKLSGNFPAGTSCYDFIVDVPSPLQKDLAACLTSTESIKEIDACDELICNSILKIHEHRRRRAFFLGFSQSPAEFINALIASQSKDL